MKDVAMFLGVDESVKNNTEYLGKIYYKLFKCSNLDFVKTATFEIYVFTIIINMILLFCSITMKHAIGDIKLITLKCTFILLLSTVTVFTRSVR